MEKQRDKAARRAQRKLMPTETGDVEEAPMDEMGRPLDAHGMENPAGSAESMTMPSSLHE
jgi:hypothetical protein